MSAHEDAAQRDASPVSASEFAERLAAFSPSQAIAVALSGGPDSLALLVLAARWAKRRKRTRVVAFTVDHGLRRESAAEAREAARLSQALGVAHRVLRWEGDKPKSGIQAAARAARYRLLIEACQQDGLDDLLVAHHLEDQAETFLLRLARGSGVDGLSGMAPQRRLHDEAGEGAGVRLLRPLLDLPRARLLATVAEAGLSPILDPSNENDRFDRVRMRKALSFLSSLGLDPVRLANTASHMARARAALEMETEKLFQMHGALSPFGVVSLDLASLLAAPSEIALRAIGQMLRIAGGNEYGPRMDGLTALYESLTAEGPGRGRTLGGVKFAVARGRLTATREVAAARKAPPLILKAGGRGLWDGRFLLHLEKAPRAAQYEVRALGAEGVSALRQAGISLPDGSRNALQALPALWQGDCLISAPHLGTLAPQVKITAAFRAIPFLPPENVKPFGSKH